MKVKKYLCLQKAEGCEGSFVKFSSFQATCRNIKCAIKKAQADREKKELKERRKSKRELKEGRLALRTIAGWCHDARKNGFNPWVRLRDRNDGCIVCGSMVKSMYHAGHFMAVGGRPELQFHPDNCHKQCSGCNCSITSVASKYRANLVKKIGLSRVEYLENYHSTIRWTIEEITEIRTHYQGLTLELKKEIDNE